MRKRRKIKIWKIHQIKQEKQKSHNFTQIRPKYNETHITFADNKKKREKRKLVFCSLRNLFIFFALFPDFFIANNKNIFLQ
jgi:hypothetical protein